MNLLLIKKYIFFNEIKNNKLIITKKIKCNLIDYNIYLQKDNSLIEINRKNKKKSNKNKSINKIENNNINKKSINK